MKRQSSSLKWPKMRRIRTQVARLPQLLEIGDEQGGVGAGERMQHLRRFEVQQSRRRGGGTTL